MSEHEGCHIVDTTPPPKATGPLSDPAGTHDHELTLTPWFYRGFDVIPTPRLRWELARDGKRVSADPFRLPSYAKAWIDGYWTAVGEGGPEQAQERMPGTTDQPPSPTADAGGSRPGSWSG